MSDLFGEERLQFFLRNRDDIKAWAAIEVDVAAATVELLARAQPSLEESLLAIDPSVLVGRNDSGRWERIVARRESWPDSVSLALEWEPRNVDLFDGNRPKLGVFWWAGTQDLIDRRVRCIERVDRIPLQRLGYKVPMSGVWPVGAWANATREWWQDPQGWMSSIVERLTATWPLVAPVIDEAFSLEPHPQTEPG